MLKLIFIIRLHKGRLKAVSKICTASFPHKYRETSLRVFKPHVELLLHIFFATSLGDLMLQPFINDEEKKHITNTTTFESHISLQPGRLVSKATADTSGFVLLTFAKYNISPTPIL